jgi:hypothetical protein
MKARARDRKNISIRIASAALQLGFLTATGAYASEPVSPLVRAQTLYTAGDPSGSLRILDSLLRDNPSDAGAHYLKANCLVLLKRNADAFNEYTLVERLAPKSAIAVYSHKARVQLDQLLTKEESDSKAQTQNADGAEATPPGVPPGTLELIRKQAELAKNRAVETGKSEAENEMTKADYQAKTAQERAERLAAEAAAQRNGGGSEQSVLNSPEQSSAIRSQATANAERLKQIGKMKAEMKEQESQEKAEEIERQAAGLQDQLLHKHRSRMQEIELNPVGTNLYIRNYSSVPSSIAPLRAQTRDLTGAVKQTSASASSTGLASDVKQRSPGAQNSQATGQGALDKKAVTSVKGQLLPNGKPVGAP